MGLLDVLSQYKQPNRPPPQVFEDFDQVAREAEPEDLEYGLEEAFNDDETPPAEEMIGQLYEKSDDDTRAGLLNEILGSLWRCRGRAAGCSAAIAGAATAASLPRKRTRSPRAKSRSPPRRPRSKNPNIIQAASRFYARHPRLVQTLGQAALAILMRGMARRRRI